MAWAYTQNFDGLTTGDLNGQDSWSANTSIDVQTSVVAQGSKAISWPNNLDAFATRAITGVATGRVHISLRSTVNNANGPWFALKDASNYLCIVQLRDDGQISMFTGASLFDLGAYSANTWYDIIVDFDCATDQYRVSIDNGAKYSDWKVFWGTATSTAATTVCIGSNTSTSSGTGYADDIKAFSQSYTMNAVLGEFALTSIATILSKSLTMSVAVGEFTLTGVNAILQRGYSLVATVGEFTLTGIDVAFKKTLNILTSVGEFSLTGIDTIFTRALNLITIVGEFTLTGKDSAFSKAITMIASLGEFTLTGVDTLFSKGRNLIAETGVFSLVGKNIKLWINGTAANWRKLIKPTTNYTSTAKPTTTYNSITKPATNWTNIEKT